jgi:5-methylcytosine-specific restriction protein A
MEILKWYGVRCAQRRWLHYHHIIPKHQGGPDTLENLITLCSAHHKMEHFAKSPRGDLRRTA